MSGDMQAFQDRGEPWRQMFGIDGTAGDAQDREHPFVPDSPGGCCVVCGMARAYRKHTGDFAEPPPPADFYDEHEDMFPALIRNSRWSCLDCPEPSGEPWESITDYCAPAACHHHATGHRVNGSVEVRYRAQTLPSVVAGRGAADGTP